MTPRLSVTITDPNGVVFDVTDRVADVRSISETVEEDLTQLTHGDTDLDLRDADDLEDQLAADLAALVREVHRSLGEEGDALARRDRLLARLFEQADQAFGYAVTIRINQPATAR